LEPFLRRAPHDASRIASGISHGSRLPVNITTFPRKSGERGAVFEQTASRRKFIRAAGAITAGAAIGGAKAPAAGVKGASAGASTHSYDVTAYGAKGDGQAIDSPAINKAVDAAAAAGGGTVIFPAGTYLCYSIHLKSHVSLFLADGSKIVAADTPAGGGAAFDLAEPNVPWDKYQDYGHSHWHNSLMWGENLNDVSIYGPGLIWGKGLSRGEAWGPVAETPGVANKAIALKNCRNVLLRDFSVLHGGHFAILATGVDNLTIDNLTIDTQRDGIDVDCCRNVRISSCSVNSPWDDAICLKSSFGLGYARSTEHVTISDCYVTGIYEEGSLLDATYKRFPDSAQVDRNGRIKFGTESNGGFKNIAISNCVFDGCYGLAIISVDGAVIEDVTISNIALRGIIGAPIFVRLGSRMRAPEGTPVGMIRRLNISNIVCSETSSQACSLLVGVPGHSIEDIRLSNFFILHPGAGTAHDAAIQLTEREKEYPEPTMFGETPAHGFFIRHAAGVDIEGVKMKVEKSDARPCFFLEDVHGANFVGVQMPKDSAKPLFVLKDVSDIALTRCKPIADTEIDHAVRQEL
jgi:polygalacturonase